LPVYKDLHVRSYKYVNSLSLSLSLSLLAEDIKIL